MDLDAFAKDFLENILNDAQAGFSSQEDVFTENFYGHLVDAEQCFDPVVCYYKKPGLKVNAYEYREETDTLVLFVSLFDAVNYRKKISEKVLHDAFKRGKTFFTKCLSGFGQQNIEESSDAFSLAQLIFARRADWTKLEIYVITNGVAVNELPTNEEYNGIEIAYKVWDIERLYQFLHQSIGPETLRINFLEEFGKPLQCLRTPDENGVYSSYIAIIPGEMLARIYDRWGQRLIERNVRSFLQATGSVNKGIRDTIANEPQMFMAYNNGISTTADAANFVTNSDNGQTVELLELTGWQIVNGGQTTASLYTGFKKKDDLSNVFVQMKLTIIEDSSKTEEIVSAISRYANSQTKINLSDFNSNDKFHVALERLSRSLWAPNKDLRGKSTTKWFYERARGQYMVEANRQLTPKKKLEFKSQYPTKQKLLKTDIAKYEMSWRQFPHLVSRGAETNFTAFTKIINTEMVDFEPDQDYFKTLVAKAILFKECDKIVKELGYPGYKANVVTYSIALLSYLAESSIDLIKIWQYQDINDNLRNILMEIVSQVREHIMNPTIAGTNITQWCKKEKCWDHLKEKQSLISSIADFVAVTRATENAAE